MNVIVIDDDKSMHIIMEQMLKQINHINLKGCFFDTWSAYTYMTDHTIDIIFIDISMPKESGLEFSKRLREEGSVTKIVFVTSHKEYALSAFDVYAFDYIVKPVNQARLQQTIERAFLDINEQKNKVIPTKLENKLKFHCLGNMELRTSQNELIKWKTSKSTELFAYLILQRGKRVSRARIIEDMFDYMPTKNAETYLNTTVYQLRKLLSSYGISQIIYSDNQYYSLDYSQIDVDAFIFEDQCNLFDFSDETQVLRAVEHEKSYQGHLFGEHIYGWAQNEIERLFQIYISFSHKLSEVLLSRGEMDKAINILKKLIDSYALEDRTMMLYLKALALKNDEIGLKRQYKKFSELMREEMGVNISNRVTDFYYDLIEKLN